MGEVWGWQEQLARFGTRYTGSPGHAAYVDWLTSQLGAVPGFTLRTDRLTFNRWLARDYALRVKVPASVGVSGPVPLTYYYPYSGQTPPGGVTAKLVDLGTYPPAAPGSSGSGYTAAFWASAKGAIALVRTAPSVFSLDLGQTATGGYEPGKTSAQAAADYTAYAAALAHPAWQGILPTYLLQAGDAQYPDLLDLDKLDKHLMYRQILTFASYPGPRRDPGSRPVDQHRLTGLGDPEPMATWAKIGQPGIRRAVTVSGARRERGHRIQAMTVPLRTPGALAGR